MAELDARQLKQVLEICRHRSFARAAQALAVSQPTLSKSIARIEDRLKLKLFERSSGGAEPTAFGAYLAQRAEEVLGEISAVGEDVVRLAAGDTGRIRIGAGPSIMDAIMPHFMTAILGRFPRLQVSLVRELGTRLIEQLAGRELDIAIANLPLLPERHGLEFEPLPPAIVAVAVRPGHPLAARSSLRFADVLEFRLASTGFPSQGREQVLGDVPAERWANYEAILSTEYPILKRLAAQSDIAVAGPVYIFREEVAAGSLVLLDLAFRTAIPASIVMTREARHLPVLVETTSMLRRLWLDSQNVLMPDVRPTSGTGAVARGVSRTAQ